MDHFGYCQNYLVNTFEKQSVKVNRIIASFDTKYLGLPEIVLNGKARMKFGLLYLN